MDGCRRDGVGLLKRTSDGWGEGKERGGSTVWAFGGGEGGRRQGAVCPGLGIPQSGGSHSYYLRCMSRLNSHSLSPSSNLARLVPGGSTHRWATGTGTPSAGPECSGTTIAVACLHYDHDLRHAVLLFSSSIYVTLWEAFEPGPRPFPSCGCHTLKHSGRGRSGSTSVAVAGWLRATTEENVRSTPERN